MTRWNAHQNNLHPAIPFIFLTDSTVQQVGTGGTFITFDTIQMKSSHFEFTAGKDRIYLNTNSSGIFKISFETSVREVSAANESYWWIYKNGTKITESKSTCKSNDDNDDTHVAIFYYVYLEKDDYIQIEGEGDGGGVYARPNTTRLSIEFMPMRGWNNSSGGRVDYKGGVIR